MLPVIAFDKDGAYKNQTTTMKPLTYRFPGRMKQLTCLQMACLESDYFSAFGEESVTCGRVAGSLGLTALLPNRHHL